ncbi:MAG: hypothetical protein INR65_20765, partial [Gluconacetobacter diazotrophicus]|nr:hypothetical protein [Gluconacetobacter diazotrophicus]
MEAGAGTAADLVRGHADGLVGAYVTGWATAAAGSCRITVHAPDGTVLGSGVASRRRPDLAVLGGSLDIGFRVLVADLAGSTLLHVRADGVELPNSPLPVGPDRFDGDLVIRGDVATGWVRARVPEPLSPRVTLHAENGEIVGAALAQYEMDAGDPHSSRATFRIAVADAMFGVGEFTLAARANGQDFARALGSLPLDGYLDVLDAGHCAGWLVSPAAPHRQLRLEIHRDGAVVGRGRCDVERDDLRGSYPIGWRNGFSVALDPADRELGRNLHTISIRTEGGGTELLGGPHLFGDRFSFLSVARGLSRLAHAPAPGSAAVPLSEIERAVLQDVLRQHLAERRHGPHHASIPAFSTGRSRASRPIDVLIPIYKGIDVTENCIRSVLGVIRPNDRLILVADCPPEAAMPAMLDRFRASDNVVLLRN